MILQNIGGRRSTNYSSPTQNPVYKIPGLGIRVSGDSSSIVQVPESLSRQELYQRLDDIPELSLTRSRTLPVGVNPMDVMGIYNPRGVRNSTGENQTVRFSLVKDGIEVTTSSYNTTELVTKLLQETLQPSR